jgi:cephalosporin hydroxylase
MEHFYGNIQGWFTWPSFYKDMVHKFPTGSSFIEVGSYKGQSLAYLIVEMINAGKIFNIIAVDSFAIEDGLFDIFNANLLPIKDKFSVLYEDSTDASKEFENKSLDFVFIDANHLYECVLQDIKAWLPKIKDGGIIAGHDYSGAYPGVEQAVSEIFGDKVDKNYINELCWLVNV